MIIIPVRTISPRYFIIIRFLRFQRPCGVGVGRAVPVAVSLVVKHHIDVSDPIEVAEQTAGDVGLQWTGALVVPGAVVCVVSVLKWEVVVGIDADIESAARGVAFEACFDHWEGGSGAVVV